jgi:hypothetical protein
VKSLFDEEDNESSQRDLERYFFWQDVKGYAGVALVLSPGAITLALQVFWYLRDGWWTPLSLLDGFQKITAPTSWFHQPDSWYGAWNLIQQTPLSAAFFFGAIGLTFVWAWLE